MLKIEVREREVEIHAEGTIQDLIEDLMRAIRSVYNHKVRHDLMEADFLKFALKKAVEDDSPMWEIIPLGEHGTDIRIVKGAENDEAEDD